MFHVEQVIKALRVKYILLVWHVTCYAIPPVSRILRRRPANAMTTSPQALTPPPSAFQNSPMPAEPYRTESEWSHTLETSDDHSWSPESTNPEIGNDDRPFLLDQRGTKSQPPVEKRTRNPSEKQLKFWRDQTTFKNSIAAKLHEAGMHTEAIKLECCHTTYTVGTCLDCGTTRTFPNRCDLFFCPECYHSLTAHRSRQVKWWVQRIPQPKHVCLTITNIPELTKGHVTELQKMFARLRRRKFAQNWDGGFYSVQVTKKSNGWHLHIHALINARWVDQPELCRQWAAITNQAGRITKVKDCRDQSYLERITSYVARGNELAEWGTEDLKAFIHAFSGKRTFSVFGSLFGMRTEFSEWIKTVRDSKPSCDCGSRNVRYESEAEFLTHDFSQPAQPRPPPTPETPDFKAITSHRFAFPD